MLSTPGVSNNFGKSLSDRLEGRFWGEGHGDFRENSSPRQPRQDRVTKIGVGMSKDVPGIIGTIP